MSRCSCTLLGFYAVLLLGACSTGPDLDEGRNDPYAGQVLLFNSGFEDGTHIRNRTPDDPKEAIYGTDNSCKTPNKWGTQTVPADPNETPYIRIIGTILTEGTDTTRSSARIVNDPTDPNNKVLRFRNKDIVDGATKSRVQVDVGAVNLTEFYQSVRVYLHPDIAALKDMERTIEWLTLLEWWNSPPNDWLTPGVFRISVNLAKDAAPGSDFFFDVHGQDVTRDTPESTSKFTTLWEERNMSIPIQFGKWMTLETYYKEGEADTGRFMLTVQYEGEGKQTVFDIYGQTRGTGKSTWGVPYFSPMKFYTARWTTEYMRDLDKAYDIFWDDLKIWRAWSAKITNN